MNNFIDDNRLKHSIAVARKMQEIKKIHDYDVCKISYYEIHGGNKDFFDWIDESVSRKKLTV